MDALEEIHKKTTIKSKANKSTQLKKMGLLMMFGMVSMSFFGTVTLLVETDKKIEEMRNIDVILPSSK